MGAAVVVALFTLLVGLFWAFQRSLIYLPDDGPVPAARTLLPGARDVTLTTRDGLELGAWYLPAAAPDAPAATSAANVTRSVPAAYFNGCISCLLQGAP